MASFLGTSAHTPSHRCTKLPEWGAILTGHKIAPGLTVETLNYSFTILPFYFHLGPDISFSTRLISEPVGV